MFRTYEKIQRLGKEETDGILDAPVHVQEKIDGANLQVWMEDGVIHVGSRNNDVTLREDGFNGAVAYIQNHEGIKSLFLRAPSFRLYGEWLVRHTIHYKETAYNKFYLFDIFDEGHVLDNNTGKPSGSFLDTEEVNRHATTFNIETPHYYGKMLVTDLEQLKALVGKSMLGEKGEGVVIKRPDFKNKFGDTVYAKMVSYEFMEDNAVTFGGNNKYSNTYLEMYFVNKYMTLARVQKVCNKIQSEVPERLDMQHIPRVMNTAYHDLVTEEAWDIAQKGGTINFKEFQRLCYKKAKQIYIDVLNDSISVADLKHVGAEA